MARHRAKRRRRQRGHRQPDVGQAANHSKPGGRNGVRRTVTTGNDSRDRQLLIKLSKEFGLLSSLTSFVAEHRSIKERNQGTPATRRVPVMLANGWGEVLGALPPGLMFRRLAVKPKRCLHLLRALAAKLARRTASETITTTDKTMDRTVVRLRDSIDRSVDRSIDKGRREYPATPGANSDLFALLAAQTAAGAIPRTDAVTTVARKAILDLDENLRTARKISRLHLPRRCRS